MPFVFFSTRQNNILAQGISVENFTRLFSVIAIKYLWPVFAIAFQLLAQGILYKPMKPASLVVGVPI
jgi:hypothetical protein